MSVANVPKIKTGNQFGILAEIDCGPNDTPNPRNELRGIVLACQPLILGTKVALSKFREPCTEMNVTIPFDPSSNRQYSPMTGPCGP